MIEDDNPDRVRGVVHNNSLVRLYMNAGADASIEPRDPRGADRPRDEAARRPARRAPAPAQLDRRSSPTSTGARSGSSPSRTSSRRSSARSRTRPTRAPSPLRRLTDGDWYVRGHVSLGDLEDAGIKLPVDSDAYNSIGGYVFSRARPAAEARRQDPRQRLRDPGRVGAREPDRGGPHPPGDRRAPGAPGSRERAEERRSGERAADFRPWRAIPFGPSARRPKGQPCGSSGSPTSSSRS